jgi:hypothetical protein
VESGPNGAQDESATKMPACESQREMEMQRTSPPWICSQSLENSAGPASRRLLSACKSAKFLAETESAAMQNLAEEFEQFRSGPSREELNHMLNLPQ